jgi:hypothetical protein
MHEIIEELSVDQLPHEDRGFGSQYLLAKRLRGGSG